MIQRLKTDPQPITPVGILSKQLQALAADATARQFGDDEFRLQLRDAAELAGGLEGYISQCTTPASPALQQLARQTAHEDWSGRFGDGDTTLELESAMLSGHVEGQFLQTLILLSKAKSILEIGMFTGYATMAMAEAAGEDARIVALEIDPFVAGFAQSHFDQSPIGQRIDVRVGSAIDSMDALIEEGRSFDFVFLDADKGGYEDYFRKLIDSPLLSTDALICVDNTMMQGDAWASPPRTANGTAIHDFNRMLCSDDRIRQVMIPMRDGITLIQKRSSTES